LIAGSRIINTAHRNQEIFLNDRAEINMWCHIPQYKENIDSKYKDFKNHLKSNNLFGISLDLDDTIADSNIYWGTKINEITPIKKDDEIVEYIEKYKYIKKIPEWNTKAISEWVGEQLSSNSLIKKIPSNKESLLSLKIITEKHNIICYLTGRTEVILEGTSEWLSSNGFPDAPVLFYPDHLNFKNASEWKALLLCYLYPHIYLHVDDNEEIIDYLPYNYAGKMFMYKCEQNNIEHKSVINFNTWKELTSLLE